MPIVPVQPGTLLRMFPERHPDGKCLKDTTWLGKQIYYEGHPVFEVKSYILDEEGGHVTLYGEGATYVMGSGEIKDKKFPFPCPMFEILGEAEAAQSRLQQETEDLIELARHPWGRWFDWLRVPVARFTHT